MNLQDYHKQKKEQNENQTKYRSLCTACMQPGFSCYCHFVQKVDCGIEFIILIHPIEVKRRIATGRMSHLCLENSQLIKGEDFAQNERVNIALADPSAQCVILYPGRSAMNLSEMPIEARHESFSRSKRLVVFVIDGTWATAGRMIRRSPNLMSLPKICFVPKGVSQFRVRKQPKPECFSTIEAIHQTIELLGEARGFDVKQKKHDGLLHVFNQMVEKQLTFVREAYDHPKLRQYRRPRFRVA